MKRNTLIIAAGLALIVAGYCCSKLLAQPGTQGGAAQIKVAVLNIDAVFAKYEKAKFFKKTLDDEIAPLKTQADKLKADAMAWQEHLRTNAAKLDPKTKESYEQGILGNKRKLEDLDREARKLIGKKQEDQLVQLYAEVVGATKAYSVANGFHMVFGYGEPFEGADVNSFPNISRKMQGMGLGAVPVWYHDSLDITTGIIATLNQHWRNTSGGTGVLPTGGSTGKQ